MGDLESLVVEENSDASHRALEEAIAEAAHPLNTRRNWLAFFTLGLLNNFGYVVTMAGAADLVVLFRVPEMIGAIAWACVGAGLGVRALNGFVLAERGVAYNCRVWLATIFFFIGYLGLAVSTQTHQFWLTLVSCILSGAASSFGESVILGFLKDYPASLTGAWSSGTGFAGVAGVGYYMGGWSLFHSRYVFGGTNRSDYEKDSLSLLWILGMLVPGALIYGLAFFYVVVRPGGRPKGCGCRVDVGGSSEEFFQDGGNRRTHLLEAAVFDEDDVGGNNGSAGADDRSTLERIFQVHSKSFWRFCLPLMLVYFLEYVASVGCAQIVNSKLLAEADEAHKHGGPPAGAILASSYVILQFCYQFGVLLSRSSLSVVRIHRTWFITLLQALNFFAWLILDYFQPIPENLVYIEFVAMLWIGLLGGCMYVNVFANVVESKDLDEDEKELSINIICIYVNLGIVAASLFDILMDSTFLAFRVHELPSTG
jgi:battenin